MRRKYYLGKNKNNNCNTHDNIKNEYKLFFK